MDDSIIKFPVEQHEQARQPSADNLLAREIYQQVATLVAKSLAFVRNKHDLNDLDEWRSHAAILIDGKRGSGKSSVLVNFEAYLTSNVYKRLNHDGLSISVSELLILKPIDPTLMEDSDDLLLNIIVAALMRDNEVRQALEQRNQLAEGFYHQLQNLSNALQGVQTHKEKYGMDRLRSFMGNHGLAQEVHMLFKATLALTGKQLILMPIDDVDTSLEHAFANIEVIRKYIASPYVVPLVSGDLSLYDEVIWRNFHGRILKDCKIEISANKSAVDRAKTLSQDYQQKVLPLPRRIYMPNVQDYLSNRQIKLTQHLDGSDKLLFELGFYYNWVNAVLNQQLNGFESSELLAPITSVRDLAQMIAATSDEITQLNGKDNVDFTYCKQLSVMSEPQAKILAQFRQQYNQAAAEADASVRRKKRDNAYESLAGAMAELSQITFEQVEQRQHLLALWNNKLNRYFAHKRDGGKAFFVTQANQHWLTQAHAGVKGLLAFPLFNPTLQNRYSQFVADVQLRADWELPKNSDIYGFDQLPSHSVLKYPMPELGRPMSSVYQRIGHPGLSDDQTNHLELIRMLMCHRYFYQSGKEINLVFTGRLFEFVVLSMVRDIGIKDIRDLLDNTPYYSAMSLAVTEAPIDQSIIDDEEAPAPDAPVVDLMSVVETINNWRAKHVVQVPSALLVYNVMYKLFGQQYYINPADKEAKGSPLEMLEIAYRAFNGLLAACGSFEKSDVFGLGNRIVRQNINAQPNKFENTDLYNLNVRPFEELPKGFGSLTRALCEHPMRLLMKGLFAVMSGGESQEVLNQDEAPISMISEEEIKLYAEHAGTAFYRAFSDFKSREYSYDFIESMTQQAIEKYDLKLLFNEFESERLPQEFRFNLMLHPRTSLSAKTSYRKLVRFIRRYKHFFPNDMPTIKRASAGA